MKAVFRRIKRILDFCGASVGLAVVSPVLGVIAIAIRCAMGKPVLFRQKRPGFRGRPFLLLKFRTMIEGRDSQGKMLPDAQRLTPLGRFLRSTSLDELPSLWNVVRGDLSLVGPRPLLMEYLDRYSPRQARRHLAPPGITGWAQVNGRRDSLFSERLEMDVWYVENWSLLLDARILAMTVLRVLAPRGIGNDQDINEVDDVGLNPEVVFRGKRNSDRKAA